jgi:hypothetical protein
VRARQGMRRGARNSARDRLSELRREPGDAPHPAVASKRGGARPCRAASRHAAETADCFARAVPRRWPCPRCPGRSWPGSRVAGGPSTTESDRPTSTTSAGSPARAATRTRAGCRTAGQWRSLRSVCGSTPKAAPNQPPHRTGHATDGCSCFHVFARVSRLVSGSFGCDTRLPVLLCPTRT